MQVAFINIMSDQKYPSQLAERFQIRLPDGLRDRIRASAEANGRSMNAEIVKVLEERYPPPISLDEVVSDIEDTIKILKRFKGKTLLLGLADQLDMLVRDISYLDEEGSEEAKAHANAQTGVPRFPPPDD